jgi:hypothetical protein
MTSDLTPRVRLGRLSQNNSPSQGSKNFFPFSEVKEILTPDLIRKSISTLSFFENNELDVPRFVNIILETCLRIFATLLVDGNEKFILGFLFRRYNDLAIPNTSEQLHFLPEEVMKSFLRTHWGFDYVVLCKDDIHRHINPKQVFPYIEDNRIGEGAYGTVFKVKTPTSCQKLIGSEDDELSSNSVRLEPVLTMS